MLGKIDQLLVNYLSKYMLKVVCFLDDSLSLVKLFFEAIPSSHFVQQTLQKSKFIVNVKKPIWKPQEVKAWNSLRFESKIASH